MFEDFQRLVELLRRASRLSILTGAGCSTASGIPDYRDHAGEWKRPQPVQYQAFITSHAARRRYWSRSMLGWPVFHRARPGAAHSSLALLANQVDVTALITQNVDGLHQRAGSTDVLELHGGLSKVICLGCGALTTRDSLQTKLERDNPQWLSLSAQLAPDGDADIDVDVDEELPFAVPQCLTCGGLLKPDVVFFGESVPKNRVRQAADAVGRSEALLVVGSSLMVFSGWRFVRQAHEQGIPIGIINRGITRGDEQARVKLERECGSALGELVRHLERGTGGEEKISS